jgi:hypothetical protein
MIDKLASAVLGYRARTGASLFLLGQQPPALAPFEEVPEVNELTQVQLYGSAIPRR